MASSAQPRLIVPDPDAAITFYRDGLGAELQERYEADDGTVVHARLVVGSAPFTLAAEVREWGLFAPESIGGSASLVTLDVDDARAVADRMVAHGAEVVVPIEDRPYGRCEGRVRDPFGHLWIPTHALGPDAADDERWPGVRRIVADLPTKDTSGVVEFYRDVLGLDVLMDQGLVVTLGVPDSPGVQLTLLVADPSAPVSPAISVEVQDLDGVLQRAERSGQRIVYPLSREPWGVERFFVEDPAGNVVNVLHHVDSTMGT